MIATVALYEQERLPGYGLRSAIEQAGLRVHDLTADPASVVAAAAPGVAWRAPGGLLAQASAAGAHVALSAPTPRWFAALPVEVTGREWLECGPAAARASVARTPTFVKLAAGKHPSFPARRFVDPDELDAAVDAVAVPGCREQVHLLATSGWLPIESEYRTFTVGRDVVACSPYRVEDDPWTPLLHTHRASFHTEARAWVQALLTDLPEDGVPPAGVLDVARLTGGRFTLLEANTSWGAGLYSCAPTDVLRSVLAANDVAAESPWLWLPDHALQYGTSEPG